MACTGGDARRPGLVTQVRVGDQAVQQHPRKLVRPAASSSTIPTRKNLSSETDKQNLGSGKDQAPMYMVLFALPHNGATSKSRDYITAFYLDKKLALKERTVSPTGSETAVVRWLDYSPPTKANRVRFPTGSPLDFSMWESCRTMPLYFEAAPFSSRFTLIGSQDLDVNRRPHPFAHSFILTAHGAVAASRHLQPGSTLGGTKPRPLHVGNVTDFAVGFSRVTPAEFRHRPNGCKFRLNAYRCRPNCPLQYVRCLVRFQDTPVFCCEANHSTCDPLDVLFLDHTVGGRLYQLSNRPDVQRLGCSPLTKASGVQSPAGSLPDMRKWETCRTPPPIGGSSRGSPVSPALQFRRCSILTSFHPHRLSSTFCCSLLSCGHGLESHLLFFPVDNEVFGGSVHFDRLQRTTSMLFKNTYLFINAHLYFKFFQHYRCARSCPVEKTKGVRRQRSNEPKERQVAARVTSGSARLRTASIGTVKRETDGRTTKLDAKVKHIWNDGNRQTEHVEERKALYDVSGQLVATNEHNWMIACDFCPSSSRDSEVQRWGDQL
ncbi:hypothetical protein PR048_015037 [Dryococelus australis]|uniref:Uncharacterized protein n=1 Tax=Dryococelus australis TaxID=614101 RepID=A0ABQ9HFX0_9NEOP|nr:hypothetical protein PR048_015037 [Dryococelus australis]